MKVKGQGNPSSQGGAEKQSIMTQWIAITTNIKPFSFLCR